ncbi:MAG: deoxyribose-phosphate aldolase [Legionella longbeachae]|nr:deoxyribose-phosphate aldolase [Legionella longbeachae]
MILETHLNEIIETLLNSQTRQFVPVAQLIECLDLTLLDKEASNEAFLKLAQDANQNHVAAVCVYLENLSQFSLLKDEVELATVINFPHAHEELNTSLACIEKAAHLGATEIDYVLPYQLYLDGQNQKALNHCSKIGQLCKQLKLSLKIILETGAFPNIQTVYEASSELMDSGCDFLKTSTGKITQGASFSAVFAILSAIKDANSQCGLKISGGIKMPQQACNYAILAQLIIGKEINKKWFRIGASSLLHELLKIN